jgi:multicomponent K+:H+ antiporter subunit D
MMAFVIKHLPVAPIAIAVLGAALCLVAGERRRTAQRVIAWMVVLALLALGVTAIDRTAQGEQLVYLLGNWKAPYGITLLVDKLAAIMLTLTAFIGGVVLLASAKSPPSGSSNYFYPLFLLQLMGLNGAFLTADLFNLFVFFEVLLAASYGLLLQQPDRVKTQAATHYVAINLVGSALFLIAVSLLYGVTGTLNMADLSQRISIIPAHSQGLVAIAGFILVIVFAIKAALLPLNLWLTNTYRAPIAPVAALFVLMTKVGIVAIIRAVSLIFPDGGVIHQHICQALLIVGPCTLLFAAAGALSAHHVRSLIGWSVVGSAGMLVTAIAVGELRAISGALFYLVGSSLATALMFLSASALDEGGPRIAAADDKPGPQWAFAGACFFVGAAAIAGLPPFAEFIGKATILAGANAHPQQVWIWSSVLIGGLVTILAYARMGSRLFWKRDAAVGSSLYAFPSAVLVVAMMGLTVFAAPIQRYTEQAAAELRRPQTAISNILGKLPQQRVVEPAAKPGVTK